MNPTTRKALEMAQEYFTEYSGYRSEDIAKAITEALAEPKDPCGTCGAQLHYYRSGCPGCGAPVCCEACCRVDQSMGATDALRDTIQRQNERYKALRSKLAKLEPVPLRLTNALRGEIAYQLTKRLVIDMPTARAAVDAATQEISDPAPRRLTDEELDQLMFDCGLSATARDIARAIEARIFGDVK